VLVTHDWSAVIKLCRQAKVLASGKVALEGRSDEVVAGYLDLAPPRGDCARLLVQPGEVFTAHSGRNWVLAFEVEILQRGPVETAVSIEALQLGVGWEPVILTEYQRVAERPGRYRVEIEIGDLPLGGGEYSLNLFLATAAEPESGARSAFDVRGWTYGNGLLLQVSGDTQGGIAPLPVRWSEEAFA
jgi:lipopolysaccharide transport system ATP-binding protein